MFEVIIDKKNENQRVDKFVRKVLKNAPLSFIYKLFRKKNVKVNDKKIDIDYKLKENDVLKIYVSEQQLDDFKNKVNLKIVEFCHEIIYEDENILIINKPSGLLVHGDNKNKKETLTNDVLNYLYSKGEYDNDSYFTPAPAHRLDRNTSGIIIFGKNSAVLHDLMELLQDKSKIEKEYIALAVGNINKEGVIDAPLLKIEKLNKVVVSNDIGSKKAITKYYPYKNLKDYTLLKVNLLTGRTHQIRVHLSYINHPIVGDKKYGNIKVNKIFEEKYGLDSQFLHAYSIKFNKIDGILSYLSNKKFCANLSKKEHNIINLLSNSL